ncbi:MAG: hypothetical protein ACMXYG_02080 [Candidatus Woesearchaeota archaeon]
MKLTEIIDKSKKYFSYYSRQIFNFSIFTGTLIIGLIEYNHVVNQTKLVRETAIEREVYRRSPDAKVPRFNNFAIYYIDENDEIVTFSDLSRRYQNFTYGMNIIALVLFGAYYFYNKKNPFKIELSLLENLVYRTIQVAPPAIMIYNANKVNLEHQNLIGVYAAGLSAGWYLSIKYYQKSSLKKLDKYLAKGDYKQPIYRLANIFDINYKIHNETDIDVIIDLCAELAKENRRLTKYEKNFFSFFYKSLVKNLRITHQAFEQPDLTNILKNLQDVMFFYPEKMDFWIEEIEQRGLELESFFFRFETAATQEQREEYLCQAFNNLQRNPEQFLTTLETNNKTYTIDFGYITNQLILKRKKSIDAELEIRQTRHLIKLFDEHKITGDNFFEWRFPEIVAVLDNKKVSTLDDEVLICFDYENGCNLKELLELLMSKSDKEKFEGQKETIFDSIITGLTHISRYGINNSNTNLDDMIKKYISSCDNFNPSQKQILYDGLSECLTLATHFQQVYDVDANPNNFIITKKPVIRNDLILKGRIYFIDHEARPNSDPIYMLVRLLESQDLLERNEEDFGTRNRWIDRFAKLNGFNLEPELIYAHYYASVSVKAFGYCSFSKDKKGTQHLRDSFISNAIFAQQIIEENYHNIFSLEKIKKMRSAVDLIASLHSNYKG